MNKFLQFFVLCFLLLSPLFIFAQEKKPKVALVLSGGGAKGIAHIPTLQMLDSLGIVPDLIVGTSMGSIVGALYALGYSGDSIASITNTANWNELLGGDISLLDVSMEEKSEFKRYLLDLDLEKGKPKVKSSLLKDQNLREFITSLTYPSYNIKNFDDLSIPYRAMTTDIVNGKEVVLGQGSLSFAMRASMSIPGVFQPVPYKDVLLVDGGVLNNFPVDIAKNMGADIIIGSDVGGGMVSKEELENLTSLLFQTGMLSSNLKNPINRDLCDILIDHIPNLTYTTGDFTKSKEIYEQGKIATIQNKHALVSLEDRLKGYQQRTHQLPYIPEKIVVDTIVYNDISEDNLDLVKSRSNLKSHKEYSPQEIIEGINRAMGTNIFNQITFNPFNHEDKLGIQLNGFEKAQHQIKGSLHYDNYRGVGILVNYTGRNIIGKSSRMLVSIDLAEQPRFRVQYQKNFGEHKKLWWKSEAYGQRLDQKVFLRGELAKEIRYQYFQFDNQINKNINSLKSFVGMGMNYEYTYLRPTIDPNLNEDVNALSSYDFQNFEIYGQYIFNTMNQVFYPTKGMFIKANLSRSLLHDTDVRYSKDTDLNESGNTNGFTKLKLDFEKRISFKEKYTAVIGATAGFIFVDELKSDDISFLEYGYAAKYFLGGNLIRPRKDNYMFPGLHEDELPVSQFMMLKLGLQFNPINNFYLTPHFNFASVGFDSFDNYIEDAFSPKGDWQDLIDTSSLISAGLMASYNSFLGPVEIDISYVNNISKIRIFFSVGIQFNRSN